MSLSYITTQGHTHQFQYNRNERGRNSTLEALAILVVCSLMELLAHVKLLKYANRGDHVTFDPLITGLITFSFSVVAVAAEITTDKVSFLRSNFISEYFIHDIV